MINWLLKDIDWRLDNGFWTYFEAWGDENFWIRALSDTGWVWCSRAVL